MPDLSIISPRGVTAEIPSPTASKPKSGNGWFRCQVQADADTSGFSAELAALLQNRLRLAASLIAATFLAMLLLDFVRPDVMKMTTRDQVINYGVFVVVSGIALFLWWRKGLDLCGLRRLEAIFFVVVAAHFTYISLNLLSEFNEVQLLSAEEPRELGFGLATFSFMFIIRWCLLIIIYGVFIPNFAWKTTVWSVVLATIPLALMIWSTAENGLLARYLGNVFPYNALVLGLSSAVAIFGSHKIATLQQEAYTSRQLGQYHLRNRLGHGGMGEVYLAEHMLLKRPCVVKLIKSERAADPATQTRFEREVKAMASLTHWNTVAVFDYGRTVDGTFYYVMEFLPGLSLQEIVASFGPLGPARVVAIMRQVCAALNEAHAAGLIHRDIKPSNIMVCPLGGQHDVVKLLDFGLVFQRQLAQRPSSDEGKLTRDGYIVGTPDFMAPEQAQDGDAVDGRSDLYSLGAVGYFLLTGETVYPRKTAMQVVVAHVHEAVPPLPGNIPRALAAVIYRCLEKQPAARFQTARELDDALAEVAADLPWREADAEAWWKLHQEADKAAQINIPTLITAAV